MTTACLTEVPPSEEVAVLEIPSTGLRAHPTTNARLVTHRPTALGSVVEGAAHSPLRHHRQGSFCEGGYEGNAEDDQHALQRRTSGSPKPALHVHHHHHHEDDGTSSRGHRRWIEFCRSNESLTSPLSWSFDARTNALGLDDLVALVARLFEHFEILERFDLKRACLEDFIRRCFTQYLPNPYHNVHHAADVTQCTAWLVANGHMGGHVLDWTEVLGLLLACIGHDTGHPGTNNDFEAETNSARFLKYGNKGTLEKYHLDCCLDALQGSGLLAPMSTDKRDLVISVVSDCVLATDMARHFEFIRGAEYVGDVFARRISETTSKQRRLLCSLLIKAADVSNPMRPFSAALDSAVRCLAEFTAQGDREAALNVTVPPGRNRALIRPAKSQLDFIGFIVKPLFLILVRNFPVFLLTFRYLNQNVRNYTAHGDLFAEALLEGYSHPDLVPHALAALAQSRPAAPVRSSSNTTAARVAAANATAAAAPPTTQKQ